MPQRHVSVYLRSQISLKIFHTLELQGKSQLLWHISFTLITVTCHDITDPIIIITYKRLITLLIAHFLHSRFIRYKKNCRCRRKLKKRRSSKFSFSLSLYSQTLLNRWNFLYLSGYFNFHAIQAYNKWDIENLLQYWSLFFFFILFDDISNR